MTDFDKAWPDLVEAISVSFRFTEEEKKSFEKRDIARLIGALPFEAGCRDPERIALAHLGTYVISYTGGKKILSPKQGESPRNRLERISNFPKSLKTDSRLLKRGLDLLYLNMLEDYERDVEEDKKIERYNPSEDVDIASLKKKLEKKLGKKKEPRLDKYMTVESAKDRWWAG